MWTKVKENLSIWFRRHLLLSLKCFIVLVLLIYVISQYWQWLSATRSHSLSTQIDLSMINTGTKSANTQCRTLILWRHSPVELSLSYEGGRVWHHTFPAILTVDVGYNDVNTRSLGTERRYAMMGWLVLVSSGPNYQLSQDNDQASRPRTSATLYFIRWDNQQSSKS